MRKVGYVIGALSCVFATQPAAAQSAGSLVHKTNLQSAFMRVYGSSQPPYGFVRFCEQNPEDCEARKDDKKRHRPTPYSLSELDKVNRAVNRAVLPATDAEIYGVSEYWTMPGERGDCEDYALLKQRLLIARGWSTSSLLLTVVRDEKGEGHAVLTARTSQGDYVLDNKIDEVRLWNRTGYEFVMRQSYIDPRVWVSLDPSSASAPASLAGTRH